MSDSSLAFDRFTRPPRHRSDPLSLADEPITGAVSPPRRYALHWLPAVIALALFAAAKLDLLPMIPW